MAIDNSDLMGQKGSRAYWCSRVFVAAWIAYAGFYFCRKNIGWTPLPASATNHWFGSLANLIFLFSLGYTVGLFFAGWMADRYGTRITLLSGGLLSVLCTALIASGVPTGWLIGLQMLNGFGQGAGWPAVNKLFSVWFARSERAVAMAWWSTSYVLGGFLATALATALSTVSFIPISTGSRLALIVPSVVLLLTTTFFYWRTKDSPEDAGLQPIDNAAISSLTLQQGGESGWGIILRNREVQLLAVMYFFLKLTRYALLFWLPFYLLETQHSTKRSALSTASLFELVGFIGAILAVYFSDRFLKSRRYPVGATMMFAAAFVFLLHPIMSRAGWGATAVSISLIGILIYGTDSLMAAVAVLEAVPSAQAGRASGFVDGVGSVGQMLSPLLVTQFAHWFGWDSIFNLFMVCSLIAGALLATRWDKHSAYSNSIQRTVPATA